MLIKNRTCVQTIFFDIGASLNISVRVIECMYLG